MRSFVSHIFVYTCKARTLTAELQRTMPAMAMRCYRKILRISYKDRVTKEEVRAKIHRRPPDHRKETQTAVIWSCLLLIRSGQNHLVRHSERSKKTRQTEEEVGRRIREWSGLEFARFQRAVENREKWKKLVVKLSVVV